MKTEAEMQNGRTPTPVREKIRRWHWAKEAASRLAAEAEALRAAGVQVPLEPGGWWHQYVCPEHHTELLFDELDPEPRQFRCPYGCTLEGEPYRGAWLVYRHQELARFVLKSAALYAAGGDPAHAEAAKTVLLRAAEQYPRYPVHPDAQPWMLKGRAFHQALTEAIWSTTLIRGLLLLQQEGILFGEEERQHIDRFLEMLGASMEQYRHILIHDRGNPENNYTAWLNACLACVYAAQEAPAKLERLIGDEGGFIHHLSIGVKPDGFEFEGSTYYHIFVLRAYFIFAEMAERLGTELFGASGRSGQTLERMLDAASGLSGPNGELPALHDGPYRRIPFARETAEVFEIGYARYGKESYLPVLADTYEYLYGAACRTGLEALLYGQGEWEAPAPEVWARHGSRRGLLLPESGFAVLRHPENPLTVLADYGEHGGSHGHFDKLHISLYHRHGPAASDLGMVPYGSVLRKEWYAETASHNTVSINGRSQAPHTGLCLKHEEGPQGASLWLRSEGAYDGAVLDRHLFLAEGFLLDWFRVILREEAEADWWFHPEGGLTAADSQAWQPAPELPGPCPDDGGGGYGRVRPVRMARGPVDGAASVRWSFGVPARSTRSRGDIALEAVSLLLPGSEWMEIRTPGTAEDPAAGLQGVLHRCRGTALDFVTVFREQGGPELTVHWNEMNRKDGLTVRIGQHDYPFRLDPAAGIIPTGGA